MIASLWTHWVWPASGSGGIPGDVIGSLYWSIIVGIAAVIIWPRVRHAVEKFIGKHVAEAKDHTSAEIQEIHRHLSHMRQHLGIPEPPEMPQDDAGSEDGDARTRS